MSSPISVDLSGNKTSDSVDNKVIHELRVEPGQLNGQELTEYTGRAVTHTFPVRINLEARNEIVSTLEGSK